MALSLGLLVPLYTDEVATKFVRARFFAEEGKMLSLFPQCASGFILDTPISLYPAASIYSLLYSNLGPLGLRVSGVLTAFIWLALLSYWVFLTIPGGSGRIRLLAFIGAVFGLGVLPLTLVLARAEQWLILLLVAYCVFFALAERVIHHHRTWVISLWFVVFCIVTSLFFYAHPKAVFFLPVVLVSAVYVFGIRRKLLLGLSVCFAIVCAAQSMQLAKSVIKCEEAPTLSRILSTQTINLAGLRESPKDVMLESFANLISAPNKIVRYVVFQKEYQSGWLPPGDEGKVNVFFRVINTAISLVMKGLLWSAMLVPPILFVNGLLRKTGGGRKYLIFAIWLGLAGHLAIYKEWNFYGGALPFALALMLFVLCVVSAFASFAKSVAGKWSLATIFLLSLVSFMILLADVSPRLFALSTSTADTLAGQPLSVRAFNFDIDRDRLRELAKNCAVQGDGAMRLVVDDLTYFAFDNLRQPLHLIYLYEGGFGADIGSKNIRRFLSEKGSSGIIAQCTYLPPSFNGIVVRSGNYCCVNFNKN